MTRSRTLIISNGMMNLTSFIKEDVDVPGLMVHGKKTLRPRSVSGGGLRSNCAKTKHLTKASMLLSHEGMIIPILQEVSTT
jgi:hypothetical protein